METAEALLAPARAPEQAREPRAQASEPRRNSGGTVIGLAPTAASAEVLGADLAAPTDTVTKFVQLTAAPPGDLGGATTRHAIPLRMVRHHRR